MAEALDLIVVSFFFGIVADGNDSVFSGGDRAGFFGGDFKFAVGGGHRADNGLAILEGKVKSLGRNDGGDSVPLKSDVTCKIGFKQESLRVGLDDSSGQPVAIFQGYLIG